LLNVFQFYIFDSFYENPLKGVRMNWKRIIRIPAFEFYPFLVSLFLTTHFLLVLFEGYSFRISHIPGIVYSRAVLDGIDPGKRVNLFYLVIISAFFIGLFSYVLVSIVKNLAKLTHNQLQVLSYLSITGLFGLFFSIMGWTTLYMINLLWMILVIKIAFYATGNLIRGSFRPAATETFFSIAFCVAFLSAFGVLFLFNTSETIRLNFNLIITAFTLLSATLLLLVQRWNSSYRRIALFLIPLSLIPVLAFIAGEAIIYTHLINNQLIRFKFLFIGLLITAAAAHFLFIRIKRPAPGYSARKVLEKFLLPSLLFAIAVLAFYRPVIDQSQELFELANPANSMIRVFVMNQIPFVDYMSSHMISEQWFGILHEAIFGFENNTGFMAWEFFNRIVILFIIYWLLNRVFVTRELSILFIISFPFLFDVFFVHLIPAALVMFICIKCFEKPMPAYFSGLFFSIMIMILWRLDAGSAALFSAMVFLPLIYYSGNRKFPLKSFIAGTLYFMGFIVFCLILVVAVRSPHYIMENFVAALRYIRANLAHGYSIVAWSFPHQFYIHHFLLPASAVLLIINIIITLRKNVLRKPVNEFTALASLFFFLIYLFNAQRGLVRHSFIHTDAFLSSTFFLAMGLWITWIIRNKKPEWQPYLIFYPALVIVFLTLKVFSIESGSVIWDKATGTHAYHNFDLHFTESGSFSRITVNDEFNKNTFQDIRTFLDSNLTQDQTFLDFSNTPMLYYYCKRSIPGYFNQNLQNTVDDYLQMHLLKQVNPNKVPVVIFSAYPPTWFDATDGVPNIMRYYMIAEYIFSNYQSLGIINNKSIWVRKGLDIQWDTATEDTLMKSPTSFFYGQAAYLTGEYFKKKNSEYLEPIFHEDYEMNPEKILVPGQIVWPPESFIKIRIISEHDYQSVMLTLFSDEKEIGTFTFDLIKGDHNYFLRAGNHYKMHIYPVRHLIQEYRAGITLQSVTILKDNRSENWNANHY
jgi:hypothetical protein